MKASVHYKDFDWLGGAHAEAARGHGSESDVRDLRQKGNLQADMRSQKVLHYIGLLFAISALSLWMLFSRHQRQQRTRREKVIVVGGGVAGLSAAQALRKSSRADVVVSRRNHAWAEESIRITASECQWSLAPYGFIALSTTS